MLLKSFDKLNTEVKTQYIIFENDEYVEDFIVDYLAEDSKMLLKLMALEDQKATVRHIHINHTTGLLEVSVSRRAK